MNMYIFGSLTDKDNQCLLDKILFIFKIHNANSALSQIVFQDVISVSPLVIFWLRR